MTNTPFQKLQDTIKNYLQDINQSEQDVMAKNIGNVLIEYFGILLEIHNKQQEHNL